MSLNVRQFVLKLRRGLVHGYYQKYKCLFWYSLSAAICISLLWFPFGFSLGGLIEEWDLINQLKEYSGFWNTFPGNPTSESLAARPLQILVFFIAYSIAPYSFLGFHLVLISICFLRIVAAAIIGRYIFKSKFYGLVLGLLAFLIPSDTQHLAFRTISISCALSLMLTGAAAMILASIERRRIYRWPAVIISMCLSIVATLIYEPIFTLYAIPFLAFFARGGLKKLRHTLRRMRLEFVIWMCAPLINLIYLFYTVVIYKSGYQQLFVGQSGFSASLMHNFHYLLDTAVYRVFYQSWLEAANIIYQNIAHWPFLIVSAVLFMFMLYFAGVKLRLVHSFSAFFRIFIVGFILFTIGYVPYMISEAHMVITQRTLMTSSFGASIIFVLIFSLLFGKNRLVASCSITAVLFVGFVAQLYQIDTYTSQYTSITRPYMSMVTDRVNANKHIHLIIDRTGLGGYLGGMFYTKIMHGPADRLGQIGDTYILCKDYPPSLHMTYSQCELEKDTWLVREANGQSKQIAASEVDAIFIGDEFNVNYASSLPSWQDLGSYKAHKSIFIHQTAKSNWYSCFPDSEWGYTGFCRGDGWADGRSWRSKMNQTNYLASISPSPSLRFTMEPSNEKYKLQVKLFAPYNTVIFPQLAISVNGVQTPFELRADQILEANVKPATLKTGLNTIEFRNEFSEQTSTILAIESLIIAPENSRHLLKTTLPPTVTIAPGKWLKPIDKLSDDILLVGYSIRAKEGTWTEGSKAIVHFAMPSNITEGTLLIEAAPYLNENHHEIQVSAEIKGETVISKTFSSPIPEQFAIPIGKHNINNDGSVWITLKMDKPVSPPVGDDRKLGIFISRYKLMAPTV